MLAVLLLALVGVGIFHRTLPSDDLATVEPGDLAVAAVARGSWELEDLTVTLTEDRLELLEGGRPLWASPIGEAFITAGRGKVEWQEHRGYFWPSVDHDSELADQQVTDADRRGGAVVIRGRLLGDTRGAAYTLTVRPRDEGGADLQVEVEAVDSVALISARDAGAGVHGFGAQFAPFDLDGRLLPIVVREQGVGRGTQPLTLLADLTNRAAGGTEVMTYAAWASFVTDDLRGVRLDPKAPTSHAFAVADLRDPGRVGLELWSSTLHAEVTAAASPADLVIAQQAGDNRPELADWPLAGAVVGLQGGTEEVRRELATQVGAGADISAVWLQDWSGQRSTSFGERLWWTWQRDEERYPGWDDLVAELRERGIRTTTYVNPFLVDAEPKGDPSIRNLWAEARDLGHLVETPDAEPYLLDQGGFDASLVDLTDPAARGWYAEVIASEVLTGGVDGFMADFGEGLPFDAVLTDGDAADRHNEWPALWADTVRDACDRADKPDCVTWFRSGSLGQGEDAALFWLGDQLVDFGADDGLASALRGALSAGLSGWPLVHSDVGGYTSVNAVVKDYVRSSELLRRWAEVEAFGVVMRTHEGNRPAQNLQVADAGEAEAFARMTRLFAALAPYRRAVVDEATRTGLPAIRHGWLVAPGTPAAQTDRQFFLGESVLVAPVLEEGAESVSVAFPPGEWVHLLTGEEYTGDRVVDVAAPLGTPAVFVRADDPWLGRLRGSVAVALERPQK